MHRRIWKPMIAMLVLTLLVGTVPAMAVEEEDGLSVLGSFGNEVAGLGAANENAEPAGRYSRDSA